MPSVDAKISSIKQAIARLERPVKGMSYFAQQRREQQAAKLKVELAAQLEVLRQ
jgi:hypothetical protein